MKPSDSPTFFQAAPPQGRSRESTIVLTREGRFRHDGDPFAHDKLESAMHTWIRRHPDDGRFILSNGYDWTYFQVEDTPFTVRHLVATPADGDDQRNRPLPQLALSDATHEPLRAQALRMRVDGALSALVKPDAPGGPYEARFTQFAQASLAPFLTEMDGHPALVGNGQVVIIAGT